MRSKLLSQHGAERDERTREDGKRKQRAQGHAGLRLAHRLGLACHLGRQQGIDAATLFPTPIDLCPVAQFPHAHAASGSVLNLPLSTQLTEAHIDRIVRAVRTAVLSVDEGGRAAAERRAA